MGWTWYLGNDMLFFVLCPLYVLAWRLHKAFGGVLVVGTVVASTAYVGWANSKWDCRLCHNTQQCSSAADPSTCVAVKPGDGPKMLPS